MTVQIIGSDLKSRILYENTVKAVKEAGIEAEIVKVTGIDEIVKMGVIMTPALAVDNSVKTIGRILRQDDIIAVLKGKNKTGCSTCPSAGPYSGPCCCGG